MDANDSENAMRARLAGLLTGTVHSISTNLAHLFIDIETGGKLVHHPLMAVGTCLYVDGVKTETRLFVFRFYQAQIEPECWESFWSKHLAQYEFYLTCAKTSLSTFMDYVDALDARYNEVILVSDNPAVDIGFLNAKLSELGRNIQYRPARLFPYRLPICQNTFLWSALVQKDAKYAASSWVNDADVIKEFALKMTAVYDHRADNDAEWIGEMFMAVLGKILASTKQ